MISDRAKKIAFISVSTLLIMLSGVIAFLKPVESVSEKIAQTYETDKYVVGVYEEKIAVFTQGDSVPIEIYDVYVKTLPVSDQNSLRKGISIQGKSELKRVIEDYTS